MSGNPLSPSPTDQIAICGLGVTACIGVPDEERALPQHLELDLTLWPAAPLHRLEDDICRTIDYSAVALVCRRVAAARPRRLIETLAEEICEELLGGWPLASVRVGVRKFILPDTRCVSVTLTRSPADFAVHSPA